MGWHSVSGGVFRRRDGRGHNRDAAVRDILKRLEGVIVAFSILFICMPKGVSSSGSHILMSISVVDQLGSTRHICSRIPTFAMGHFFGVAERTLSLIKALDSAWKTLEPCDRELLHHTQFMPMLFRFLRCHK